MKNIWRFLSRNVFRFALGAANAILFVKMLTDAITIEPTTSRIVFAGFDLYFVIAFVCMIAVDATVFLLEKESDE